MRPRLAAALGLACIGAALALTLLACGARSDPFVGLWWEPTTGRRIEISQKGDAYTVLYGATRVPYTAERRGGGLLLRDPLGGDIVIKTAAGGTLTLTAAGRTTTLKPVPQHQ